MNTDDASIAIWRCIIAASRVWGVKPDDLVGKSRPSSLIDPRFAACAIAKEMTGASNDLIGRIMGGRDESTIHHAIHSARSWIQTDKQFRKRFNQVKEQLKCDA